ncbi:effector-associated domain EAD1-containing protein [Streptomyces sp. NPDC096142]|uniref:effector-associated domain EAD1-containing protein n=1 Tax=Streptomyces sp. NPDC096142 TaxID=3366077 RepID=UPI0038130996
MRPLLDEPVFPLDDTRAQMLLKGLMKVYANQRSALPLALSAGLEEYEANWDKSMFDVWPQVLEKAARRGKLRRLVELAAQDPNTHGWPVFGYLAAEGPDVPEADPCFAHLISGRQRAFIDRRTLRALLQEMLSGQGNRVLAVRGDQHTGRTYTWYLIQHVLAGSDIDYCRIQMGKYLAPVAVTDIANNLSEQFRGWNVSVDRYTSEDSQALSLVNQIKGLMREERRNGRAPGRHWLVFDDSESVRFTEPALRAVAEIVAAVVEEEMADQLRIVLLAYDGWLSPDLQLYVSCESLEPIKGKDLHDYFLAVAEDAGRPIDADQADRMVRDLAGQAHDGALGLDTPLRMTEELQQAAACWARDRYRNCGENGDRSHFT